MREHRLPFGGGLRVAALRAVVRLHAPPQEKTRSMGLMGLMGFMGFMGRAEKKLLTNRKTRIIKISSKL